MNIFFTKLFCGKTTRWPSKYHFILIIWNRLWYVIYIFLLHYDLFEWVCMFCVHFHIGLSMSRRNTHGYKLEVKFLYDKNCYLSHYWLCFCSIILLWLHVKSQLIVEEIIKPTVVWLFIPKSGKNVHMQTKLSHFKRLFITQRNLKWLYLYCILLISLIQALYVKWKILCKW